MQFLYHTTSADAAEKIIESEQLLPKDYDSFVSLSATPIRGGDIAGDDVILKVEPLDEVIQVKYNRRWFEEHPEQAAYIAGEGWMEQFEYSMDTLDEDGFSDEELEEQEFMEGMYEAFVAKRSEQEWISVEPGKPLNIKVLDVEEI